MGLFISICLASQWTVLLHCLHRNSGRLLTRNGSVLDRISLYWHGWQCWQWSD